MDPTHSRVDDLDEHLGHLVEAFTANADAAYNIAYRILWNRADAQDAVQAAFISAFTHQTQLQDPARIRPWILQITYRRALTIMRQRRDQPTDPSELPERPASAPTPEEAFERTEVAETIRIAIDHIPETQRTAFLLRDVEGLSMAEVAEVMGIGPSAAKMRVARGRAHLRTALKGSL